MNVTILAKAYDKNVKAACEMFGFKYNDVSQSPDIVFNYNLTGKSKRAWLCKNRLFIKNAVFMSGLKPMDNYNILKLAEALGIPTIKAHKNIPFGLPIKDYNKYFITNRRGKYKSIKLANYRFPENGEFIQKKVDTRDFCELKFMYSIYSSDIGVLHDPLGSDFYHCIKQVGQATGISSNTQHVCNVFMKKLCINIKPDFCVFKFLYNKQDKIMYFTGIESALLGKAVQNFSNISILDTGRVKTYLTELKKGGKK